MLNFPVQGLAHVSFDALLVQQAGSMFRSRRNALVLCSQQSPRTRSAELDGQQRNPRSHETGSAAR